VLGKIFGPRATSNKGTGKIREELYDLYFSPKFSGYQFKKNKMGWARTT